MQKKYNRIIPQNEITYLSNFSSIKNGELSKFAKMTEVEQNRIFADVFAQKLYKSLTSALCDEKNKVKIFKRSGRVYLEKNIAVEICGRKKVPKNCKCGASKTQSVNVTAVRWTFAGFNYDGVSVQFNLTINTIADTRSSLIGQIPEDEYEKFELKNKKPDVTYDILSAELEEIQKWTSLSSAPIGIDKAINMLNTGLEKDDILKLFFDVLHEWNIASITGKEAVMYSRMWNKVNKTFPQFEKLSDYKKIELLTRSYYDSWRTPENKRDEYTIAMCIFNVLERNQLADKVKYNGKLLNCKDKHYYNHRLEWAIFESNTYGTTVKETLRAHDIWNSLVSSKAVIEWVVA